MGSILKSIQRLAAHLAGSPGAVQTPNRFESESGHEAQKGRVALSTPGQFKTVRGQTFRHGLESYSEDESLYESRWIAFEGVRLRVSLYRREANLADRITFCGKDAQNCPEARAWAARLQRANGVWFPRRGEFARFCGGLGWSPRAVEIMLEIYFRDGRAGTE